MQDHLSGLCRPLSLSYLISSSPHKLVRIDSAKGLILDARSFVRIISAIIFIIRMARSKHIVCNNKDVSCIQSYREKGSCKCGSFEDNNRRNILGHQPQLKGLFCYLILLLWRLVICTHIHMIYNSHTLESTFKELRS